LIEYRPFRNGDPPALVDIWRSTDPHALAQGMNISLLEDLVLGKPYFDREGLLVACENGTPVGFGHAGFGPSPDRRGLACEIGVICLIVVLPSHRRHGIGRELSARLEEYLRRHGSQTIYAGGVRPLDPFYSGLYGGVVAPGLLESDAAARRLFEGRGFGIVDHLRRLRCELGTFRPTVDRRQMQARRSYQVASIIDPPPADWWEACTYGDFHRIRCELGPRGGGSTVASMTLWSADSIAWRPGERTLGLVDVHVSEAHRRQGLATFLVGEALRQVQQHGFTAVEAQILERDEGSNTLLKKLGFVEIGRGAVYRKDVPSGPA